MTYINHYDYKFNFPKLEDYNTLDFEDLLSLKNKAELELENIETELNKEPIQGLTPKMKKCFSEMPDEIIEHIKKWNTIRKSPYSCSLYSDDNITWDFKPDGVYSVSDHWNFNTKGKFHKLTNEMVINNSYITLCKFNQNINPATSFIFSKKLKNNSITIEEIEKDYSNEGVWEVIISLPKDTNKMYLKERTEKLYKRLKRHISYINDLFKEKDKQINMKNIQSFEDYKNEITEGKSEDGNVKIFNKQKDSVIAQNKEYNFEPIPAKFKDKDPNYDIVISKKIEIGAKDPVKKFREWSGNFWRKAKQRKQKYEPQAKQ